MTELLTETVEVRVATDGDPVALRLPRGWRRVRRITNRWLIETDWWRMPVRRLYHRCLLEDGECLEIHHDLERGTWHLSRRYD